MEGYFEEQCLVCVSGTEEALSTVRLYAPPCRQLTQGSANPTRHELLSTVEVGVTPRPDHDTLFLQSNVYLFLCTVSST